MSLLYTAGERANLLEIALTVTSTNADANYPLTHLYQAPGLYQPWRPFRFSAIAADLQVTVRFMEITNGNFETPTLYGWTESNTGTGSTAAEGAIVYDGSAALKCSGGAAGVGARYQDIVVRSGSYHQLSAWLRGDAGAGVMAMRLQNLHTGNYYSAGAWGAAADLDTQTAAAYAEKTHAFQVESFAACGDRALTTLRVWFRVSGNGSGYADAVAMVPGITFASVHGHNLTPVVSPQVRTSTDGFTASDDLQATMTIARPAFFSKWTSPVYRAYWRLKLSGTPAEIPYLGELVLGCLSEVGQPQSWGYSTGGEYPQARSRGTAGQQYVDRRSDDAPRLLRLLFEPDSETHYAELRDELWRRSYGGQYPVIVVPDDELADVLYGRLGADLVVLRDAAVCRRLELVVSEEPLPMVGL